MLFVTKTVRARADRRAERLASGRVPDDAARVNETIQRRLPHVVTRADLVLALTPTYASALSVDEDEARERLERALQSHQLLQELHAALSRALVAQKGPRTTEDALVDKLSAGVQARRSSSTAPTQRDRARAPRPRKALASGRPRQSPCPGAREGSLSPQELQEQQGQQTCNGVQRQGTDIGAISQKREITKACHRQRK